MLHVDRVDAMAEAMGGLGVDSQTPVVGGKAPGYKIDRGKLRRMS